MAQLWRNYGAIMAQYGRKTADLQRIRRDLLASLRDDAGDVAVISGETGCGKTTQVRGAVE